jgi:glucose-1-phosphate cytidylyltransferase
MKVVLFCGGFGLRLRDYSETIPKPMVAIGNRPILWHIMKYYAHFGHKDFILCLGWQGDVIKEYFLNYDECMSNNFVLSGGGTEVRLLGSDIHDWNITFVDTGTSSSIGERLRAVERFLEDDQVFLANYADDLTDFHLPDLADFFHRKRATGAFLSVRPAQSFHTVQVCGDGRVEKLEAVSEADVWINGGYYIFHREIFDYVQPGEDLVAEPFHRLMAAGKLVALKYEGFWGSMDTYKEKQRLDDMYAQGIQPWAVWDGAPAVAGPATIPVRPRKPNGYRLARQ